jgi:uncharacterized ParB-like nuclease family protein
MSESSDYRRSAATRAVAGGALIGAGAGIKSQADKKLRVKNGTITRNFTIIGPDGLPAGTHSVLEDKMVKPNFMHGVKGKKFTSSHAKFLGAKTAARSIQGAGAGLAVAGGKQFYGGQQNEKFNLKREVVRPLVHADAIEAKIKQRVTKADTDQDKLIRSKERTRRYLQVGGAIGGGALLLRTPELAGVLRHSPKSKVLRRVSELEPKATKVSNSLLAVGSGIGAAGAFNSAQMQKLESKRFKEIGKADKKSRENNQSDNKKVLAGTAAGVGLGVSFPTLQKTPLDSGASARINSKLANSTTGNVDINDVRGVARTPGKRYGAKQNQAKLTSKIAREGFSESRPIEVSRFANGQMVVTNGHHRLRAAEDLGQKSVPIRVRNETAKAPRSVVPLYRAGSNARSIVEARQPRKPLNAAGRKAMEDLAAKDVPKYIERANKIKSVSEEIPHRLNTPRNKVAAAAVGAAGLGAYGANRANESKIAKKDDKFLRQYRDRISPNAEQGYKHLRSGAKSRQVDAVATGALGAGLASYSAKEFRNKNKSGAALSLLGGAVSLKESADNAYAARAWNAKANKIKQRAYQRERDGEFGSGRNVDMAKSMWVEKGLSVGLPYPKGMRRSGIRPGHLRRTRSGKTITVRGSVG